MAIQGVSFMGQEGCITPAAKDFAKEFAKEVKTYMGKEPIGEVKNAVKDVESKIIREADLKSYLDSRGPIEDKTKDVSADKLAEAWKAAHGIQ